MSEPLLPPQWRVWIPWQVEPPRDEVVPGRLGMEQAQFDVEITKATPKRSELEEVPESRRSARSKVWRVCSTDIVGAAQADHDDPRSSGDESMRKAEQESDAVHTHEGRADEEFRGPHSGAGHRGG